MSIRKKERYRESKTEWERVEMREGEKGRERQRKRERDRKGGGK